MDIFVPIRFRTNIQLAPSDLVADFERVILDKVRSALEGVCSRYGYIRPGSIAIVKRSAGMFIKQHFNGHINFDMICKAEVCNPANGSIFKAVVKNKNALGVHAESTIMINDEEQPVLNIIIPKRSAGITSTINLEEVSIGDTIHVEVLGKRYQLHDKKISIIGRAIKEVVVQPTSSTTDVVDEEDDGTGQDNILDMDVLDETEEDDEIKEDDETDSDNDYTHKGGADDEEEEEEELPENDDDMFENDDQDDPADEMDDDIDEEY